MLKDLNQKEIFQNEQIVDSKVFTDHKSNVEKIILYPCVVHEPSNQTPIVHSTSFKRSIDFFALHLTLQAELLLHFLSFFFIFGG